jgi:hypothetical protein
MAGGIKLRPSDIVFSQYVRLKAGKCARCGSPVQFNSAGMPITHQASHFQGRRKEATRFDLENVDCMCGGCHLYLTAFPYEHTQWQIQNKGKQTVEAIVLRSNGHKKRDDKMDKLIWSAALKDLLKERQSVNII